MPVTEQPDVESTLDASPDHRPPIHGASSARSGRARAPHVRGSRCTSRRKCECPWTVPENSSSPIGTGPPVGTKKYNPTCMIFAKHVFDSFHSVIGPRFNLADTTNPQPAPAPPAARSKPHCTHASALPTWPSRVGMQVLIRCAGAQSAWREGATREPLLCALRSSATTPSRNRNCNRYTTVSTPPG